MRKPGGWCSCGTWIGAPPLGPWGTCHIHSANGADSKDSKDREGRGRVTGGGSGTIAAGIVMLQGEAEAQELLRQLEASRGPVTPSEPEVKPWERLAKARNI